MSTALDTSCQIIDMHLELRDDVKFDTLDLLGDPDVAAKHLELQSVYQAIFWNL